MGKRKRWVCFLISVMCLLQGTSLRARAEEYWPEGPEISGESAIVMEASTGTVLYEKNSHERAYPASITKIMTALLALENSRLDENVTFSHDAVYKTEGSGISRDVDEVMTMEQCLYGLMLESSNECAYAIAEHAGKTYDNFIQMMNSRAKKLGCKDTHFSNPHGLPDENHWTSVYDMALISQEALKNDVFRMIVNTKRYTIPPTNKHSEETYLVNHHKMLNNYQDDSTYLYDYCIGGKTGYTNDARSTLVTFAEKDGMTLICVVVKEESPNHYLDTRALFDYFFENFQLWNISENEKGYEQQAEDTEIFESEGAFAELNKESCIVLPKAASFTDAKSKVIEKTKSKDKIGIIQYKYAGRVVGSADIEVTGQKAPEFQFHKISKQDEDKTGGEGNGGTGNGDTGNGDTGNGDSGNGVIDNGGEGNDGSGNAGAADGNTGNGNAADGNEQSGSGKGSDSASGGKVLEINLKYVRIGIVAIAVLVLLGFGLYWLKDNFYLLRYERERRKMEKMSYKEIKVKKKRRRRF